jgi:hypothetical protein
VAALLVMSGSATLTGCTSSKKYVKNDQEKAQVAAFFKQKTLRNPVSVDCPDKLEAMVGAMARCTIKAPGGATYGIKLTVTSVKGDTAAFDIVVSTVCPAGGATCQGQATSPS